MAIIKETERCNQAPSNGYQQITGQGSGQCVKLLAGKTVCTF